MLLFNGSLKYSPANVNCREKYLIILKMCLF